MRWEWTLEKPTVPLSRPQPEFVPYHPVPPCVHDFINAVAQVAGVQCVVVEESEQHAIHITTFARPLTDDVRERVYASSIQAIDSNPNNVFDFHLRNAEEVEGAIPAGIAGSHYFAVWGSLDAERR